MSLKKPTRIIRPKELRARAGNISHATEWRWRKLPDFPRLIRLGPNSVGYDEADFEQWLQSRREAG